MGILIFKKPCLLLAMTTCFSGIHAKHKRDWVKVGWEMPLLLLGRDKETIDKLRQRQIVVVRQEYKIPCPQFGRVFFF